MKTAPPQDFTESKVEHAQDLAVRFHEGQTDKAGQPYALHVLRVSAAGTTESERILGAIHDLLEDTQIRPGVLMSAFGEEIILALLAITREPGEGYRAYIERVGKNPLARAVKINDLRDNLGRMDLIPDRAEATRLVTRYIGALKQLGAL
jgi:hypothetical protein